MPPPVLCLVTAALVAVAGFLFTLPRPGRRPLLWGVPLLLSAVALFGAAVAQVTGLPSDDTIANVLFIASAVASLIFAGSMVIQRNPARGAIAFTSLILCLGGVYLVLGAPFLVAVDVIVYAGAIIVTFLFILMLSNAEKGASAENDRSREPLAAALGGMAFAALVGYVLLNGAGASGRSALYPTGPFAGPARDALAAAYQHLIAGEQSADAAEARTYYSEAVASLGRAWGTAARPRAVAELAANDPNPVTASLGRSVGGHRVAAEAGANAAAAEAGKPDADLDAARARSVSAREQLVPYLGQGRLPARNIGNIGLMLYSEHLIAVELAGTLLLAAAVGAVAVAGRKGVA